MQKRFNWSEEKNMLGNDQYVRYENSRSDVQLRLKDGTNISVDMPDSTGKGGTSTYGNVVHSLLSEEKNLQVMVSVVPQEFQDLLHECLTRSYVILNWQKC